MAINITSLLLAARNIKSILRYSILRYSNLRYSILRYSILRYSILRYSTGEEKITLISGVLHLGIP